MPAVLKKAKQRASRLQEDDVAPPPKAKSKAAKSKAAAEATELPTLPTGTKRKACGHCPTL